MGRAKNKGRSKDSSSKTADLHLNCKKVAKRRGCRCRSVRDNRLQISFIYTFPAVFSPRKSFEKNSSSRLELRSELVILRSHMLCRFQQPSQKPEAPTLPDEPSKHAMKTMQANDTQKTEGNSEVYRRSQEEEQSRAEQNMQYIVEARRKSRAE